MGAGRLNSSHGVASIVAVQPLHVTAYIV